MSCGFTFFYVLTFCAYILSGYFFDRRIFTGICACTPAGFFPFLNLFLLPHHITGYWLPEN
jgi:hypothetical protein